MSADVLVEVEHVSRRFCRSLKRSLWYGVCDIAGELLGRSRRVEPRLRRREFWALRDVAFKLRRGECIGLIGPNGAGKSTLLKLINGLIKPDHGVIRVRGRVGALIELGAGFHPILTGRENIYINAAVLGIGRREVDGLLDAIIDFAELHDAIDAPVQTYSSGMRVRLGFAVAAHLQPDVLLIDEVLAVGDAGFRAKCYNRISELVENTAVVFVSHSMMQVSRLANRCIVLRDGRADFIGPTGEAIQHYLGFFETDRQVRHLGSGEARVESLRVLNAAGQPVERIDFGAPVTFELTIRAEREVGQVVFDIGFYTVAGDAVAECNNYVAAHPLHLPTGRSVTVRATVDRLTLNPGLYRLAAFILSPDMTRHYDWAQDIAGLAVAGGRCGAAGQQFVASWSVEAAGGGAAASDGGESL